MLSLLSTIPPSELLFHLMLALVTSLAVGVTGLYSWLLALQDYGLRKHSSATWLRFFPALQKSEKQLFILVLISFILLTALLTSSFYFFYSIMWLFPWLLQKTLLALMAWLVFALILWGRWQFGWRGRLVTYCIASGVLSLALAYIVSQLALEAQWLI